MIGKLGEDHILSKQVLMPWGAPIPAKTIGRLVEIIDDARVILHFEGRGRVIVSRCVIRSRSFSTGDRVVLANKFSLKDDSESRVSLGSPGVIQDIWVSASPSYMYRVMFDNEAEVSFESHRLRCIPESVEVPMNIAELSNHMVSIGTGRCTPDSIPEWFQPVAEVLKDTPRLSSMQADQLEFLIRAHLQTRYIRRMDDLVANVMFDIPASATPGLKDMEEKLYAFKGHLMKEWKKLNREVPLEIQYSVYKAFTYL